MALANTDARARSLEQEARNFIKVTHHYLLFVRPW
jgi:hypothetical protein